MRRRYVIDKKGNLVLVETRGQAPKSAYVIDDIKPYRSMADGSIVTSRSEHREMLKRNGCVELGNDAIPKAPRGIPDVDPAGRKELIAAQIRDLGGHDNFKRALKRDIDFVKWNSRGLQRSK